MHATCSREHKFQKLIDQWNLVNDFKNLCIGDCYRHATNRTWNINHVLAPTKYTIIPRNAIEWRVMGIIQRKNISHATIDDHEYWWVNLFALRVVSGVLNVTGSIVWYHEIRFHALFQSLQKTAVCTCYYRSFLFVFIGLHLDKFELNSPETAPPQIPLDHPKSGSTNRYLSESSNFFTGKYEYIRKKNRINVKLQTNLCSTHQLQNIHKNIETSRVKTSITSSF